MRIAYYGIAGNPAHLGHRYVAEWLAERYDKVFVGLSAAHAFGKILPPMEIRLTILDALFSTSSAINIELTTIENALVDDGPVYSYTVLSALRAIFPGDEIHLAIGPDNAEPKTWEKFYRASDIIEHFGLVVAPNMGNEMRSTEIRKILSEGTTLARLAEVTGSEVAAVLMANLDLYKPAAASA